MIKIWNLLWSLGVFGLTLGNSGGNQRLFARRFHMIFWNIFWHLLVDPGSIQEASGTICSMFLDSWGPPWCDKGGGGASGVITDVISSPFETAGGHQRLGASRKDSCRFASITFPERVPGKGFMGPELPGNGNRQINGIHRLINGMKRQINSINRLIKPAATAREVSP